VILFPKYVLPFTDRVLVGELFLKPTLPLATKYTAVPIVKLLTEILAVVVLEVNTPSDRLVFPAVVIPKLLAINTPLDRLVFPVAVTPELLAINTPLDRLVLTEVLTDVELE
jgi:hypothetical protein